ncbi:phage tail sheath subtilisin-like domain-containing protein [Dyella ginsengisoli]|uniref:phage tail sheath subtilisin-like domain-containing protein n=1 Tax=Dyella ginsengisoli TaxID=363848 RepID=UPI000347BEFA|nr:phage tail sheath subtilisin-like domain-containing protein [Dyella ginsengisoli]
MPASLTYPGVYVQEASSGVRTITGVATSIALFIGWAARGPVDRAVRIASFADYERYYGGLDTRTYLGYAVQQFFDNGGSDAYVLRVADAGAKTTKGSTGNLSFSASSPGQWANGYGIAITLRADDVTRFRLQVLSDSADATSVVETFENLSMTATDPRFVKNVINGRSLYISADTSGSTTPAAGTTPLKSVQAGTDGAQWSAADAAFRTAVTASFATGGVIDRIDLFNLVCVPGLTDAGTISTLQGKCKARRAFLLVDAPEGTTVGNMPAALTGMTGSDASYAAIYYPWVRAPDPLRQGALASFPPCGYVAGVYARTDGARGVWKAPAGADASVNGAASLELSMSDAENGQLNPLGINCLRNLPVYGSVVWGARTLQGNDARASEWKYIPVRRMALFLEESLYRGTQWVVFEPNDEPLWAQIRLNVGAFMQNLFRQGAFQGRSAREAYFVKCDRETTTQNDINLGIVNIHVGFAPLKPAEFVVIRLQQIAGDIAV